MNFGTMIIEGKIIKKLPLQEGVSARGSWKKQDFVVETPGQITRKICISAWGDLIDEVNTIPEGTMVKAHVNIESREYNQKWYTDIKVWRFEKDGTATANSNTSNSKPAESADDVTGMSFSSDDEELPF